VTIAAGTPTGATLAHVDPGPVPADKPDGAEFPVGVLSFDVVLPVGQTTATVEIHLPAGTNPTGYFKQKAGAWVALPSSGPGTYATISGDVVTLHLVDGDGFDTNPVAGVIGDPGAAGVGYQFSGFLAPLTKGSSVKAGSTVPVRWRILDPDGVPVSDPTSFTGLTSAPCAGGPATPIDTTGTNALKYLGGGTWLVNWNPAKSLAGQCRTLSLQLDDGFGARSVDVLVK
jgi:hypothetical protein